MTKLQWTLVAVIGLVSVAGAVQQGIITDRWGNEVRPRLQNFTDRLAGVPDTVGAWTSVETVETEKTKRQWIASHCHGKVSRVYRNAATGQEVNVFLVSGKALHVTQHSPDWCYVAAGFEMKKEPALYGFDVDGIQRPEFLHADFEKLEPTRTLRLRILWSYSEDGKWTGSKHATYAFAGKPALYKVYFIMEMNEKNTPPGSKMVDCAAVQFAKEFLTTIDPILFAEETPATAPETTAPEATANTVGADTDSQLSLRD